MLKRLKTFFKEHKENVLIKFIIRQKNIHQVKLERKPLLKPIKMSNKTYENIKAHYENITGKISKTISELSSRSENIRGGVIQFGEYKKLSEYGDYLGPVVEQNGKIYKLIKEQSFDLFKKLFNTQILQAFSFYGFIPKISITNYCLPDYPLIIECEKLNLTNYNDVSIDRFGELLLFVSFLQKVCRSNNVVLIDPHYLNYCYTLEGDKVFFDIGSFKYGETNHDDFSMVSLGCYRLLFSLFPESVLFYRELNEFRYDVPKFKFPTDYREFVYYKKRFYRYHRLHSSLIIYRAAKRIFDKFEVRPEDLQVLFSIKELEI